MSSADKPRVLIIDDDPDFLQLSSFRLSPSFEVHVAKDGEEGVRKLTELDPAVVLLDLWMPRMSGKEVLEYMQARPRLRDLPVIVVTGHPIGKELRRAFSDMANLWEAYDKGTAVEKVASAAMKAALTGELFRSTRELVEGIGRAKRTQADDPRR